MAGLDGIYVTEDYLRRKKQMNEKSLIWKATNFTMSLTKFLTGMRHALECKNPGCRVKNCHKTKRLLNHYRQCKTILCTRCRKVHRYHDTQFPNNWIYKQKISKFEIYWLVMKSMKSNQKSWPDSNLRGRVYTSPHTTPPVHRLRPSPHPANVTISPGTTNCPCAVI